MICTELRRRKTLAPSSIQSSWSIADVLAAVEDLLLAQATYEAARQRWPNERIRLSQETRIVEDSGEAH